MFNRSFALTVCFTVHAFVTQSSRLQSADSPATIDFHRQVLPILAENCFACHGPDEKVRKAKLRLDQPTDALTRKSIIAAGHADQSLLIERVSSIDPKRQMPPAATGKRLTEAQIGIMRQWINEGAHWSRHWAFVTPVRPKLSAVRQTSWPRAAIDRFILSRLEAERLAPSAEADRHTLIRRLSLDLTGLPPSPDAVAAFIKDERPDAYARLVDRLLASPHFGERMALHWLDLARFGDSDGYHDDTPRVMWQFRDYVIRSFNENKRFDQFTVEQIAGDLLPRATLEQKIGSAFHRCGPTSSEGGADAAEYLAKYAVDRVNTTATVWLGLTMQCAECHDHKYDPLPTREFYQLFAFFNQVPEDILFRGNDAPPIVPTPNEEQQAKLAALGEGITKLNRELGTQIAAENPALDRDQQQWEERLAKGDVDGLKLSDWHSIGPFFEKPGTTPFDYAYPPEHEIDLKKSYEDGKQKWTHQPRWADGKPHYLRGENCAIYVYRTIHSERRQPLTLYLGSDDGIKVWINSKLVHANLLVRVLAPNQDKVQIVLEPGINHVLLKIVNLQGGYGFYFSTKEKAKDEKQEEFRRIASVPPAQRTTAQKDALRRHFREKFVPAIADLAVRRADLEQQKALLERAIPKLRIMADLRERRPTHILVRGDFRAMGDRVEPGVPAVLGRLPASDKANRLALARWLVAADHPLTARVVVNRFWQMIFGQGIVRTVNDFGIRGEPPSHPELLDWLAVEFVESGWDVKHLLRQIVNSATYRQSSHVSPLLRERDPNNVLLARAPRIRLSAELIRDNALAASGLLTPVIGGPSVKPYQPADLWREMSSGDQPDRAYVQDHGANLYRRGLYTYWKRSIHYPAFAVFDAPSREVCTAQRAITNTPLQALVTLNDVTYVEAARTLAQRILTRSGESWDKRIDAAFVCVVARRPEAGERAVVRRMYDDLHARFAQSAKSAGGLAEVGEYPRNDKISAAELAAWTGVCQALLNLDEALTKE